MRQHLNVPLALVLLFAAACATSNSRPSSPPAASAIDPGALMRHVSILAADSMEGRRIGTPGSARARVYLVREFAAAGLTPIGAGYEMPFERLNPRDSTRRRGVNVVGMIRGRTNPDRYLVVTAHYDHVGIGRAVNGDSIYNGADDDASGTAGVVELARWFRANPPAHSIIFAAFDGEEGGLTGSAEFVRQPPVPADRIVLNVNLDMIGRNAKNELYAAGTSHYPYLRAYLDSVQPTSPVVLRLGHDDPNGPRRDDWTFQSDHGSFHRAGIPFIYFGVEDHPDYHQPTDHADRLMPGFFGSVVTTIRDVLVVLDRNLGSIRR